MQVKVARALIVDVGTPQRLNFCKFGHVILQPVNIRSTGVGFMIKIMCFVWDTVRWKSSGVKMFSR